MASYVKTGGGGQRLLPNPLVKRRLSKLKPQPDYLVLVNRAWTRGEGAGEWDLFAVVLRQLLPVIAVPLRVNEPEVPLDLQHVFNRAYDAGPYQRGAIDYDSPPHPPLPAADYAGRGNKYRSENDNWRQHATIRPGSPEMVPADASNNYDYLRRARIDDSQIN